MPHQTQKHKIFTRMVQQAQLLAFSDKPRENPLSVSVEEATQNFNPVQQIYDLAVGMEQAGRCGQCRSPFCSSGRDEIKIGCPLQNNIPFWLELLARGQIESAIEEAFKTNPMPDVTGAVCPHKDLCEGSCVLEQSDWGAVTIGGIERLLGETAWEYNLVPPITPQNNYKTSIGIIGSGPAGYATAVKLAELGHHVTIYERSPKPGGLLAYGIPGFKLHKDIVTRYFNRLAKAPNVEILCNTSVGQPTGADAKYQYIPFSALVDKHDAVVIATGTYRPKNARLNGDAASRVIPAIDYLATQNLRDEGHKLPGFNKGWLHAEGKNVVVIGGGDTMIDVLRTARRHGAKDVRALYYRGPGDIPANKKDLKQALAEGGHVDYFVQAKGFVEKAENSHALTAIRTELTGNNDQWGRPEIKEVKGSEFEIPADMVVSAVGFDPEDLPALFNVNGMKLKGDGTLHTHPIHQPKPGRAEAGIVGRAFTENSNCLITAVGDIVTGARLVVDGLRGGRDLANFLHDGVRHPGRITAKYEAIELINLTAS